MISPRARLADLLAGLSLATDLCSGAPLETSLRTCLVATHLGSGLLMRPPALRAVYYGALLRHLGCTAWSHEAAALVGDDHDLTRTFGVAIRVERCGFCAVQEKAPACTMAACDSLPVRSSMEMASTSTGLPWTSNS